jgi:hypothetical protein
MANLKDWVVIDGVQIGSHVDQIYHSWLPDGRLKRGR